MVLINCTKLYFVISNFKKLEPLEIFYVGDNQLSGTIASTLETWEMLKEFSIIQNQITGTMPSNIGNN